LPAATGKRQRHCAVALEAAHQPTQVAEVRPRAEIALFHAPRMPEMDEMDAGAEQVEAIERKPGAEAPVAAHAIVLEIGEIFARPRALRRQRAQAMQEIVILRAMAAEARVMTAERKIVVTVDDHGRTAESGKLDGVTAALDLLDRGGLEEGPAGSG